NEFQDFIFQYEKLLDDNVKKLIELVPDDTKILVVSDHGAQPMSGCVCVNEWLINQGYLTLKEYPNKQTSPTKLAIDWSKTKAWGWGGYYSRVFFNVKGREPEGIIPPEEFERERDELRRKIEAMKGPDGTELGNKTFISQDLYPDGHVGDYPDLYVYFGDLKWRSAGTVGHKRIFLEENDTGPDDAVHAKHGLFIASDKQKYKATMKMDDAAIKDALKSKEIKDFSIYDIFPTIMAHFGISITSKARGKAIHVE
ncbi:MAG: alkaline phosphatase family protein, partial [Promethearchaeota archaeon]